jgi:hypothetical protein
MSDKRAYVFQFYATAESTEPAFSRTLPMAGDDAAVREGALLLSNQQMLTPSTTMIVVWRGEGGLERPLGRWIWDGEPRWTAW